MAVSSKTWAVGEVVTAGNMNTYLRDNLADLQSNKMSAAVGTYSGDGTTSQAITGIGFAPIYAKIWANEATSGVTLHVFETTSDYVDNHGNGLSIRHQSGGGHVAWDDGIISLDSDGFTVDDNGADVDPNKNGVTYCYFCLGS